MPASYDVKQDFAYNGVSTLPKNVFEGINKTITDKMVKLGYAPSSQVTSPITVTSDHHTIGKPAKFHIKKGDDGQLYAVHSTANNRWRVPVADVAKYGDFSPQVDDVQGFDTWKEACDGPKYGPNYFEAVQPRRDFGIIASFGDRPAEFDSRDTHLLKYLTDVFYEGRMNYFGKALSKAHNLEGSLKAHLRNRISQEVYQDLTSDRFQPKDIGYLGVNVGPEGIIYAVTKASDGKHVLIAADDTGAKILRLAHHLGIDPELVRTYALNEELAHILMNSIDRREKGVPLIAEERRVKSYLLDKYRKRQKSSAGNRRLQSDYEDLGDIAKKWDIPTIKERYGGKGLSAKGLENIVNDEVEIAVDSKGNVYTAVDGARVYGEGAHMPTYFAGKKEDSKKSGKAGIDKGEIKSMSDAKAMLESEEAGKPEAKEAEPAEAPAE